MSAVWTKDKAKKEKPTIKVKVVPQSPHKAQVVEGNVMGDKDGFALIKIMWFGVSVIFDAAWETVVNCLNHDRPMIY